MNFKTGNCFQNVSKVIEEGLNTLFFVHKISYGLKSKIISYYKWVIWYRNRIELILYFEP